MVDGWQQMYLIFYGQPGQVAVVNVFPFQKNKLPLTFIKLPAPRNTVQSEFVNTALAVAIEFELIYIVIDLEPQQALSADVVTAA